MLISFGINDDTKNVIVNIDHHAQSHWYQSLLFEEEKFTFGMDLISEYSG